MSVGDSKVRNILMNELGITKESVKEELYNIIREEIQKEMSKPEFCNLLAKALLEHKGNLKWEIINSASSRITATILRNFGSFLKSNLSDLGKEWEK